MKLFLFRLSLKARKQKDVFERKKLNGSEFTREEWLRDVFSIQFSFDHRGNEFFFVPERPEQTGLPSALIAGWVARDKEQSERTPPWEGLAPMARRSWQASLLLLDPTEHEDGQKIAFEGRTDVGGAGSVMASLVASLARRESVEPFTPTVFPIIEERSFAKFAESHRGEIKSITYDVAVPNMFGSPDDFSKEMQALRDNGNVARVKTKLESDDAINTTSSHLDEIATHVERGGGTITARTKNGKRYNSNEHSVSEEIDTNDVEPESKSFWERVKQAVDRIF